jgi:hypothetical protein
MFTRDWQTEPDREGLLQYVGLLLPCDYLRPHRNARVGAGG